MIREIHEVNDQEIIIRLPDSLNGKKVVVTIDDLAESRDSKLNMMKDAVKDPRYLNDLNDVILDFSDVNE